MTEAPAGLEVFAEKRKHSDATTKLELHVHAHRVVLRREGLAASALSVLLVTRYGWVVCTDARCDSDGDPVSASFEVTEVHQISDKYDCPRKCVQEADQWFIHGEAHMRRLLDKRLEEAKP